MNYAESCLNSGERIEGDEGIGNLKGGCEESIYFRDGSCLDRDDSKGGYVLGEPYLERVMFLIHLVSIYGKDAMDEFKKTDPAFLLEWGYHITQG